jgi:transcriptional regulator GlxA family with amidase domain
MAKGIHTVIALAALWGTFAAVSHLHQANAQSGSTELGILKPPANGVVNVAFIVSDQTALIDLAGPWEVFGDTMLAPQGGPWRGGDMIMPFNLYAVSDSQKSISVGGLQVVPGYTFENAPKPQVIVVPAQGGRSTAQKRWVLENTRTADITMSVCTGASMLAAYGLLDHQRATTHHMFVDDMQRKYPAVHFVTGLRYIDNGNVATAGGLSSGIDLALHVVERYYGSEIAQATADYMEYGGELWKNPQYRAVKYVTGRRKSTIP